MNSAPEWVVPRDALRKRLPTPEDLIKPWRGPPPRRIIVDSDNHHDIADPYHEAAKLKFAQHVKPDLWLNLGDHYDFESVSRFDRDPSRGFPTLQKEFDSSAPYWREVCRVAKAVEFIQGNHEHRLFKTVAANAGFFGLRALDDWHGLAGIPEAVTVHPYGTQRQAGLLWAEHGDQIRGGAYPTRWALDNRGGRAIAFGHTHRLGFQARTVRDERGEVITREAWNTGHGSRPEKQKYAGSVPAWQSGFLYVEHFTIAGRTEIQVHPIRTRGGRFAWDGVVYDGRKA